MCESTTINAYAIYRTTKAQDVGQVDLTHLHLPLFIHRTSADIKAASLKESEPDFENIVTMKHVTKVDGKYFLNGHEVPVDDTPEKEVHESRGLEKPAVVEHFGGTQLQVFRLESETKPGSTQPVPKYGPTVYTSQRQAEKEVVALNIQYSEKEATFHVVKQVGLEFPGNRCRIYGEWFLLDKAEPPEQTGVTPGVLPVVVLERETGQPVNVHRHKDEKSEAELLKEWRLLARQWDQMRMGLKYVLGMIQVNLPDVPYPVGNKGNFIALGNYIAGVLQEQQPPHLWRDVTTGNTYLALPTIESMATRKQKFCLLEVSTGKHVYTSAKRFLEKVRFQSVEYLRQWLWQPAHLPYTFGETATCNEFTILKYFPKTRQVSSLEGFLKDKNPEANVDNQIKPAVEVLVAQHLPEMDMGCSIEDFFNQIDRAAGFVREQLDGLQSQAIAPRYKALNESIETLTRFGLKY